MKVFFLLLSFIFIVSCGDRESYKNPMVISTDIVQSKCKDEPGEENITYKIDGKSIILKHENIYLPNGTIIGIEDRKGTLSYESGATYFYLEADEENINVKEVLKKAGDYYCYFDFSVRITNISGGEYILSLWDNSGSILKRWEDVRIR